MIKTLVFSVILAFASYALFQPRANAHTIESMPLPPAAVNTGAVMASGDAVLGRGRLQRRAEV